MIFLCFLLSVMAALQSEQTSTSDCSSYTEFCTRAACDPLIFSDFRHHPMCTAIIETVSKEQGQKYLDFINEKRPEIKPYLQHFKTNDSIGNPQTYSYQGLGDIAPTTLRYIKVAADLQHFFGSLDGCSIIEIGGGYGGQCKILAELFHLKNYVVVDLPDTLALAEKYLTAQGIQNVSFVTPDTHIMDQEFDLVISNYAFSECTYRMQTQYIKEILAKAKRGYLTCNILVSHPTGQPSLITRAEGIFATKGKVLQELTNFHIPWKELPETPNTRDSNYLLIWEGP